MRKVLRSESAKVPRLLRSERADPYRDRIRELHTLCDGNFVRVHEELTKEGVAISYQGLTAFCRRHGIGQVPKVAVGQYHFAPGQEMQHDTSPHDVEIGGKVRRVQTASLVLCYSRMLFFEFFPNFRRFDCKVFLTEAIQYMRGACARCMIDNTHVVVLTGTGRDMVPVPEMKAFGERYDFEFQAHEKGDANRSALVERSFDHIERNFLAGRKFRDWNDANTQAREWCDKVNARYKKHLKASPRELYAMEQSRLHPLPLWAPPVHLLHQRLADLEGYVSVRTNRYSVPDDCIGRRLEVRETRNAIEIYEGPRAIAKHERVIDPVGHRNTLPEHRRPRVPGIKRKEVLLEEQGLLARAPEIADYIVELKKRGYGRGTLSLRRLRRMVDDYPRESVVAAVRTALHYGLFDLERLERMVLRGIAREYFKLGGPRSPGGDDDAEG